MMKNANLRTRTWLSAVVILGLALTMHSCKKTDHPASSESPANSIQQKQEGFIQYQPANIPAGFILYRKNGDSIVYMPGKEKEYFSQFKGIANARVTSCGDDPFFAPPVTYKGFTAVYSGCPSDPNTTVTCYFTIEAHAELNLVPTSTTKGRVKLVGGLNPTVTKTSANPITVTYLGSYYNSYGEEVNKFDINFSVTFTATEFCNYNEISVNTNPIPTDCIDNPTYAVTSTTDYFTPQTYKVYNYGVSTSPSTSGQMTAFPLITLCNNCHDPALGSSPTHDFQYRLQGSSTWTTVTYNDLNSHVISGLTSGTYEYRSRGKLKTDGTYTPYTNISTATVY